MSRVTIEIGFLRNRHSARTGHIETGIGDKVLAASGEGLNTARVVSHPEPIDSSDKNKYDWKIVRILNEEDYRIMSENRNAAGNKKSEVKKEIRKEKLKMNLICLNYTYDRSKLYLYYTAEGRVDFRNLIRNLGSRFKVRIQMVQVGVRDAAAILGGVGLCGREICCSRFLRNIETVNIETARSQNMVQNSENISGCCGRLLCCLRFEEEFYCRTAKKLPPAGSKVISPEGKGTVLSNDPVKNSVKVELKDGKKKDFNAKDVSEGIKGRLKKWIK